MAAVPAGLGVGTGTAGGDQGEKVEAARAGAAPGLEQLLLSSKAGGDSGAFGGGGGNAAVAALLGMDPAICGVNDYIGEKKTTPCLCGSKGQT